MDRKQNQKKRTGSLLLAIVLLMVAIIYFFRSDTSRLPPALRPIADRISASPSAPVSDSPSRERLDRESSTPFKENTSSEDSDRPKEFHLCRHYDRGIYMLPKSYLEGFLNRKRLMTVVIDEESRCLSQSRTLDLAFVEYDSKVKLPWKHVYSLKAKISKIEDYNSFGDLLEKYRDLNAIGFSSVNDFIGWISAAMGFDFQSYALRAITWEIVTLGVESSFVAVPPIHPLADIATKQDLVNIGSDVLLVDVGAVPGKVNGGGAVTFDKFGWDYQRIIFSYRDVRRATPLRDEELTSFFPRNKKIILLSENQTDGTAYNAVNLLHSMGYRNLAFFRDGRDSLNGVSSETPELVKGIETINASQVRQLIHSKQVLLFDVRLIREFRSGSLPNAKPHPYHERKMTKDGKLAYRAKEMTAADLTKNGESYEIPSDHGQGIIFYGRNQLDWKPLKAAVMARDAGLKRVYWYRKGLEDWKFLRSIGEDYPLQDNNTKEVKRMVMQEHHRIYQNYYYDNIQKTNPNLPRRGDTVASPPKRDDRHLLLVPNLVSPTFKVKDK